MSRSEKRKGGIYTPGGHYIPPQPNVPDDVREWGKLISEFRKAGYKVAQIRAIVMDYEDSKGEDQCDGSE